MSAHWLPARETQRDAGPALEMESSAETHSSPAGFRGGTRSEPLPGHDGDTGGRGAPPATSLSEAPSGHAQEGAASTSSRGRHGAMVSRHQASCMEGLPTPPVASHKLPADSGRDVPEAPAGHRGRRGGTDGCGRKRTERPGPHSPPGGH